MTSIENNNENGAVNYNIYRFKFTDDFTSELNKFSKIHQYDHRKDFKEAWEIWIEDNEGLVNEEVRRLTNIGYDGDILEKRALKKRHQSKDVIMSVQIRISLMRWMTILSLRFWSRIINLPMVLTSFVRIIWNY
jgi:hypothetical protein